MTGSLRNITLDVRRRELPDGSTLSTQLSLGGIGCFFARISLDRESAYVDAVCQNRGNRMVYRFLLVCGKTIFSS